MAIGRDHLDVLFLKHQEDPVQGIARFVVGDREACLGKHLPKHLRVQAHPRRRRCRNDRREIVRRQANELIGCAGAPQTHARVVCHLERHRSGGELLDDLGKLPSRHGDGPLGRDLRGDRDACSDLEVRRGDAHCLAVALEEDVRQNRERLARLHDVLHHLQALEKRVTVDYDFHEVLRWFSEKNNNSVVVTVCSRCGSGKLKVSGVCR